MGTMVKKVEINEGVKKMVEENAMGLATVDKKGNPHNVAAGDVKVVSKNQLLIGDNYFEETVENIKDNPHVSLAVWRSDWQENCVGYELAGKAEYFTRGKWHDMIKKIHKGYPCKGAILVTLNKMKVLD